MLCIVCCNYISAQTISLEKANVHRSIEKQQLKPKKVKKILSSLNKLLTSYGGYLELPYDSINQRVRYEYIEKVPGTSQKNIMEGIVEWASLKFGLAEQNVVFENQKSGRIIIKGLFKTDFIPYTKTIRGKLTTFEKQYCHFNIICTVKHGIYSITLSDLILKQEILRYSKDGFAVATDTKSTTIESMLPITAQHYKSWDKQMSNIKELDRRIGSIQKDLSLFLRYRITSFDF